MLYCNTLQESVGIAGTWLRESYSVDSSLLLQRCSVLELVSHDITRLCLSIMSSVLYVCVSMLLDIAVYNMPPVTILISTGND